MKALILNSGLGKRMGDLTKDNPKCLVELREGLTILGHELGFLISNGIREFIITTGPFEYKIKKYVKENFPDINVKYVNNPRYASTNAIYSLYLTRDFIDDDMILMHGDMVFHEEVLKSLINSEYKNVAIINNKIEPPEKDFKGRIINDNVKEISVNAFGDNCFFLLPVYKFSKEAFKLWLNEIEDFIKRGEINVYAENAFNKISNKVSLMPIYTSDFCMEIDNVDDLGKAKEFFS